MGISLSPGPYEDVRFIRGRTAMKVTQVRLFIDMTEICRQRIRRHTDHPWNCGHQILAGIRRNWRPRIDASFGPSDSASHAVWPDGALLSQKLTQQLNTSSEQAPRRGSNFLDNRQDGPKPKEFQNVYKIILIFKLVRSVSCDVS